MKTKTKLLIILILLLVSCTSPVLNKNEYKVVDTLCVNRNGFNMVLGYDVLIKYDSAYHYGVLSPRGKLIHLNPRKIKLK